MGVSEWFWELEEGGDDIPVGDCRQLILKDSASIDSTPELPGIGEILVAIAWMEWKVEASTRYSLAVRADSPSVFDVERQFEQVERKEWGGKGRGDVPA